LFLKKKKLKIKKVVSTEARKILEDLIIDYNVKVFFLIFNKTIHIISWYKKIESSGISEKKLPIDEKDFHQIHKKIVD